MRKQKNPGCGGGRKPGEDNRRLIFMSLSNIIRNLARSQYFRALGVRAIQDCCFVIALVVFIWLVGASFSWLFSLLGVA